MTVRKTETQKILMGIILKEANAGRFLNVKELHAAKTYPASYGAVRLTLRILERNGMIEKRPIGVSTELVPTQRGYDWFRPLRT